MERNINFHEFNVLFIWMEQVVYEILLNLQLLTGLYP